jgi:hypothetical protein
MKRFLFVATAIILSAAAPVASRSADDPLSQSAATIGRLKVLLDQFGLDAIAARDPEDATRFVAAFYMPGSQLLVVSSPYPIPAVIEKKIAARQYMDAYADLQTVRDRAGQFFVVDMQADGLRQKVKLDDMFDSTSADGKAPVVFDGNAEAQQLTDEDYAARFAADDARYARMLSVLINALARRTT